MSTVEPAKTDRALPRFTYHPDPVATGSVERSRAVCSRCGKARGYVCAEPMMAETEHEPTVCPWCVADGSARVAFGCEFFDPDSVGGRGRWEDVPQEVVDEIVYRTPGFSGWTEEMWWTHCGDAGEFLGPAGRREVEAHGPDLQQALQAECDMTDAEWTRRLSLLDRDKGPTAYVFRCRHCGAWGGYVDAPE